MLEANLSKKINFLSAYCHIHETWVHFDGGDHFGGGSACRLLIVSATFNSCHAMNYALLKFLDVNRVNCHLLVCDIVIEVCLPNLK